MFILAFALDKLGITHRLELATHDAVEQLGIGQPDAQTPDDRKVAVVLIDNDDYAILFNNSSPLVFGHSLEDILSRISEAGPTVIGVDIDTSDPNFKTEFQTDFVKHDDKGWPIVWAREAVLTSDVQTLPILGNREWELQSQGKLVSPYAGIPALLRDGDGVVRAYKRIIDTKTEERNVESFTTALLLKLQRSEALKEPLQSFAADTTERYIHYDRTPPTLAARDVLSSSPESLKLKLGGKVVLLGGGYRRQDVHQTPVGEKNGVEILANVLETELNGGGRKALGRMGKLLILFFEIFVLGLALEGVFHKADSHRPVHPRVKQGAFVLVMLVIGELIYRGHLPDILLFLPVATGLVLYELFQAFKGKTLTDLKEAVRLK